MKRFPVSAILGLTLGILLAFGVAVSAFQAPTQAPPAGNVAAPLNTGPADQTKTGGLLSVFGLWVNQALGVAGGAIFGGIVNLQNNKIINVGTPSAAGDVATKGLVDSAVSVLQKRVSGSCLAGQGIRSVASDGSVSCEVIKRTPVLSEWNNSYGTPNTDAGRYGDYRSFTVPADSGDLACSYFGSAWGCNGCQPLSQVYLTCDGGFGYNVPIIYQITFQRIEGHSPIIPGTGASRSCFLNVSPQGAARQPTVAIDGRCRSAKVQ